MRTAALRLLVAVALAAIALLAVAGSLSDPVTLDPRRPLLPGALARAARSGARHGARARLRGPLGAELRARDPQRSGDPDWVRYNAQFYERRIALPAAAAALDPVAGERAILDLSVAGYVAAVLAIFALLLLRFRLPIAAAVTARHGLPAGAHRPLELSAHRQLGAGARDRGVRLRASSCCDRGPRWLIPWAASILVLSLTRDSAWIPIAAAAWLTLTLRSRLSLALLGTGLAAAVPVALLFSMPMRELLAMMLNDFQPAAGPLVGLHRGALSRRARGPAPGRRRLRPRRRLVLRHLPGRRAWPCCSCSAAGARSDAAHAPQGRRGRGRCRVLVIPIFSAFRLELVCVPMAAFGLGLAAERLAARAAAPRWGSGCGCPLPGRSRPSRRSALGGPIMGDNSCTQRGR